MAANDGGAGAGGDAVDTRDEVTRTLGRICRGENVVDELAQLVYSDLHRLASALLRGERRGHTLQATALVHEAWLRLVDAAAFHGDEATTARQKFLGLAVVAMRRILVEHARARLRDKRGGGQGNVALTDTDAPADGPDAAELLDLDAALTALATRRASAARVAELRIYGGLSTAEAARAAGMSLTVAKGEWAVAQALLGRWLRGEHAPA